MNLLPTTTPGGAAGASKSRPAPRLPLLAAGAFLGFSLTQAGLEARSLSGRLAAARIERDRLVHANAEREHAREQLRVDREQLARLQVTERRLARWQEERLVLPDLLRGLSVALPDAVVLEAFGREGPELRITGRGTSAAVVTEVSTALSRLERVRNLELLWVEQVDGTSGAAEQRFALAGAVRYDTREPPRFERISALTPYEEAGSR